MDFFAPEFSRFWLTQADAASDLVDRTTERATTPAEERALEELADRVSAARSIV